MISRNLQCHCSPKLRFSSFHSLSAHFPSFLVSRRKSRREIWSCCLCDRSFIAGAVGRLVGIGRLTLLATARAPTGGPRWSGAGGQVVLCCCSALLLCCCYSPPLQLPGGVFGSSGGTMGMGRHCSAAVKGHMLRQGGIGAPANNPSRISSCLPNACFRTKSVCFEKQQENYLSLNGDRFSCYLD